MPANLSTSSSKKKRFTWIKLIVFLLVLFFVLNITGKYYAGISSRNQITTDYKKTWSEFYELENNSLDLIFIGSSHAYCTFDPEIIDEALGINSFNFGSPLQHPDSSYHVLKDVLKYQSPDTMVFEIYWDMIDKEFDLNQATTVIASVDTDEFEMEYILDVFSLNELAKYFFRPVRYQQDLFNYWDKHLREKVEEGLDVDGEETGPIIGEGVSHYRSKGFIYSDIVIPALKYGEANQFIGFDGADWEFNEKQKSYIVKMVQLCREEGIKPIFVTAPVANVSMKAHIENYGAVTNKIRRFTESLDVPYRDYNMVNMDENLFENINFRDDAHLNYSGVEIFMEDFIDWFTRIH